MCPKALRKLTFLFVAVRGGLRARSVRAGLRAGCPHGGPGCGAGAVTAIQPAYFLSKFRYFLCLLFGDYLIALCVCETVYWVHAAARVRLMLCKHVFEHNYLHATVLVQGSMHARARVCVCV